MAFFGGFIFSSAPQVCAIVRGAFMIHRVFTYNAVYTMEDGKILLDKELHVHEHVHAHEHGVYPHQHKHEITEDITQKSDDRGQITENSLQRTQNRGQKTDNSRQ